MLGKVMNCLEGSERCFALKDPLKVNFVTLSGLVVCVLAFYSEDPSSNPCQLNF